MEKETGRTFSVSWEAEVKRLRKRNCRISYRLSQKR
jgi:hypothetical protein